jgi:phenylpropionate dioxygenase-like ring-hydroxylating dioxygenase large terminal subunit
VLSDGTPVGSLVDFERREVSVRTLSDPDIYRLELHKVWAQSWWIVGHESEIPRAGDFMVRYIGEDSSIVSRTENGRIAILLNVCSHRAMEVCLAQAGNATRFRCSYHGYEYSTDGKLVLVPFEEQIYGANLDKSELGLRTGTVEVRHGVIFATFNPDPEPLDEYLGEMAWYLDAMFGDIEYEALGSLRVNPIEANWKLDAENAAGDDYHIQAAHHALFELGFNKTDPSDSREVECVQVMLNGGHTVLGIESTGFTGGNAETKRPLAPWLVTAHLFPASAFTHAPILAADHKTSFVVLHLQGHVPRGPGRVDEWLLSLVPKGLPEADRAQITKSASLMQGVVGPDDKHNLASMGRVVSSGVLSQAQTLKFNTPEGLHERPDYWPGPGQVHSGFHKDDAQWSFWTQWHEVMTRPDLCAE